MYILDSAIRSKIFSQWIQYRFLLFFEGYGDYNMNNLKILGWDKKPKTLYRYIKEDDIFVY